MERERRRTSIDQNYTLISNKKCVQESRIKFSCPPNLHYINSFAFFFNNVYEIKDVNNPELSF